MPFTPEEAEEIKKQLFSEVDKIPNADHDQIKKYIESLNEEQLEEFLKKNKISFSENQVNPDASDKPVFQLIVENAVSSYKLDENKQAIAILDINPLSKGHSIILPKQKTSVEKISKSAFSLAQKIAKKIKTKFKPSEVKIETFSFQNYPAINVIPIYKDTPIKKEKASEEDLKKLHTALAVNQKPKIKRKKPIKNIKEIPEKIPEFY